MVTVQKEQQGQVTIVRLTGSIEESVDFEQSIGPVTQEVHIYGKGVPRINSIGVKAWIKYFQGLSTKGTVLKFFECSVALVEQINLISNFTTGGEVVSIYVPYICPDCGSEYASLVTCEQAKALKFEMPTMKCTKCQSEKVEFDDQPEEYFYFLQNE